MKQRGLMLHENHDPDKPSNPTYTVLRTVNTTKYRIQEELAKALVTELCNDENWEVTIVS